MGNSRYLELRVGKKTYTNQREISNLLISKGFSWLANSTIEDAVLEIRRETLIWHSGLFLEGDWHYGIFKDGRFCGNWIAGVFEAGVFDVTRS